MLVKKKNPEWYPHENKELQVGETIEITDPRALIISGDVIGLDKDGITEKSAYELYGVIIADEQKDFEEYLKLKKAESTKVALEAEKAKLEAELESTTKAAEPVSSPVVKPVEEVKKK